MSHNGMRAPKCQRLCQLLKHAANLQSKSTSTTTVTLCHFQMQKSCNLALGDTEGIFKQARQTTEFFSSYSCTIKSVAFKNKTKKNC